jgi:predicted transcriptional regulator
MSEELNHIGTPRHSGRYPWGSGEDGKQRGTDFLGYVKALRDQGMSEVEIANGMGMSTKQLRDQKSLAKAEKRQADASMALRLKEKGYSNVAIGKRMGVNESSVRQLLDPALQDKANIASATAHVLRNAVEDKKYIDVGAGIEQGLGVSRIKLDNAIALLEEEGYQKRYVKVMQMGTGKYTTMKVLTAPGVEYKELSKNREEIKPPFGTSYTNDGGRTWHPIEPPQHVSSDRIHIRYNEDGGADRDGVIELKRGVEDLSLLGMHYAQVRVGVDGTHYMKGMAMYGEDFPKGKDIIYNTNKKSGTEPGKVFKAIKDDPDMPFGSTISQRYYPGADGKDHLSPLNIVNPEGKLIEWTRSISSQVLSKQLPSLAKKQLQLAFDVKKSEFDDLNSLTNPTVKKILLAEFAKECDSAAVHLKAAALPRQAAQFILPFTSIKENEVYAPNFKNGEPVVLIRHPHGGIFEIPELIVNNNNPEAKRAIEGAKDAVGIHPSVAQKLSGADFDGDTVLVIPNDQHFIKSAPSLRGLKNFDPKTAYPAVPGMKPLKEPDKERLMGVVSNLITDMTIKGAVPDEIARAVRHSMVVIDASEKKHNLNWKQSEIDNNIPALKKKYQGGERSGASTIVSLAGSEKRVPLRKDLVLTDPTTGKKVYQYFTGEKRLNAQGKSVRVTTRSLEIAKASPGETYINKKGETVRRETTSSKMAETDNAHELSSGTTMEGIYANHANALKSLGDKARLTAFNTQETIYSPSAHQTYAPEVAILKSKLNIALKNKPYERQAQLLANKVVSAKRQANPDMEKSDLKKVKGQALTEARIRSGAKKTQIELTDREWEAIQAGAISNSALSQILLNTKSDDLKERALPRASRVLSPAKAAKARSMLASGYTAAEVAEAVGVSTSTIATI